MKNKFSCVLDYSPLMAVQCYIWTQSLLYNKILPKDIYVHTVGEIPKRLQHYLEKIEVNLVPVPIFDKRNKYCNKLVQLETILSLEENFDYIFLMDCDTAIVSLEDLKLNELVYAKIVDYPNPPINIIKKIFEKEGFEIEKSVTSFALAESNVTDYNNCNGGVYIIQKKFLKSLAPRWKKYSLKCIEYKELFTDSYHQHADQVGFALAMKSLNRKVEHLELKWNFPTHIPTKNITDKPAILHFHEQIDEHLKLKKGSNLLVNESINQINNIISDSFNKTFDNSLFWDLRYTLYPELGSGVGSRGEILDYKKRLLYYLSQSFLNKKVIDIGCGDLELTREIDYKDYNGYDISREALRISKIKRPDWNYFHLENIPDYLPKADLIICFDVLIHQANKKDYQDLLQNILRSARSRVIIAGYNEMPNHVSDITNFYSCLLKDISTDEKFNEINLAGHYRDVSVVVASNIQLEHSREIGYENLNKAFKEVERPDLLQFLVDVSRSFFGFYTAHFPRVFEYSWILHKLESKKLNVLDIGAGVCPLPLCLAMTGWNVVTVDSHNLVRDLAKKGDWNEWGYLDYSHFNEKIKSFNTDFGSFNSEEKFDVIYSVSVIEHMPALNRRKIIKKAARLLNNGGLLLLTVDVVPNTDEIWNLSENKQVENARKHGKLENLKKELSRAGFELVENFVQREIPFSKTDIFYVVARLNKKGILKRMLTNV